MISHSLKPQNLWHACRNEERKGGHGNDNIGSIMNQFRQEFHESLDLNYPVLLELGSPPRPCMVWQDFFHKEIGGRCEEKERNGRCFPMMAREGKESNLELSLRLSVPGLHRQDEESKQDGISPGQRSRMAVDMDSVDGTGLSTGTMKVPSLVLMGCARCLIYVMVSEVDPNCPKCKRTVLMDVFRRRPAKKPRV
ncbi:hypothetical protein OIU76_012708 [Salix suchowensis]|nr:hypothetical protein OIU76_012708 [Salix suchowensis]